MTLLLWLSWESTSLVRMRSPVRIRVAAPDNPEVNTSGLWFFIGTFRTLVGIALSGVVLKLLPALRARVFEYSEKTGSHCHRSGVKLACKTRVRQSSRSEYPGVMQLQTSRCGSVTLEGKLLSTVFSHSRAASLPRGKHLGALVFYRNFSNTCRNSFVRGCPEAATRASRSGFRV